MASFSLLTSWEGLHVLSLPRVGAAVQNIREAICATVVVKLKASLTQVSVYPCLFILLSKSPFKKTSSLEAPVFVKINFVVSIIHCHPSWEAGLGDREPGVIACIPTSP